MGLRTSARYVDLVLCRCQDGYQAQVPQHPIEITYQNRLILLQKVSSQISWNLFIQKFRIKETQLSESSIGVKKMKKALNFKIRYLKEKIQFNLKSRIYFQKLNFSVIRQMSLPHSLTMSHLVFLPYLHCIVCGSKWTFFMSFPPSI